MKYKYDIENNLRLYIPSLFKLIEANIRWSGLTKIFNRNFDAHKAQYDNGKNSAIRHTLYSIINLALKGEEHEIQLLSYIDNVFKDLYNLLNVNERIFIKTNIANLLEFNPDSIHFLGELSVLNCLMKTGVYKFVRTEYSLTKDGKSIDFKLYDINEKRNILIEVVNIELRNDMMLNHCTIHQFLSKKLNDKLEDTDKSGIHDYTLIPVLWGNDKGSLDNILRVKEFYEATKFTIERVELPMVYMLVYINGKPENRFCSILNILE